jgi:hypothetical protein
MSTNRSEHDRRERGRVAQAAFRKRQINTIHAQEEQLRSFEQLSETVNKAISQLKIVTQVSSDHRKDDMLQHMVQELVSQLEHAIKRVPPTRLWNAQGKDNQGKSTDPTALIHQETLSQATSTALSSETVVAQEVTVTEGQAIMSASMGGVYNDHTHEETFSEDSHTFPDSNPLTLSFLVPPIEIIPYLSSRPGSKPTFAGKLFWETMSLGYRLASGAEELQIAPRLLLYHLRFHTATSIAGRVGRMLLNESTGVTYQDSAPHFTYQMTQHIVRDLVLEGEDVRGYLDAREVELYFWRSSINPISLVPLGMEDADWRLSQLLQELSRNAVCFGNGPRYLVRDVEKAFLNMTTALSMSPSLSF